MNTRYIVPKNTTHNTSLYTNGYAVPHRQAGTVYYFGKLNSQGISGQKKQIAHNSSAQRKALVTAL